MRAMRIVIGFLLIGLVFPAAAAGPPPARQAKGETVTNGYDPAEKAREQRELFEALWAQKLPVDTPAVSVGLSDEEKAQISEEQSEGFVRTPERRQRVGIVRQVSHVVDFGSLRADQLPLVPRPLASGTLYADANGMTWTAGVEAVEATGLRLYFATLRLPPNAALYVFNESGQAYGPYTDEGPDGSGAFWTPTLGGSVAYVQLRFEGAVSDEDLRGMHFTIADVAYVGPLYKIYQLYGTCQNVEWCVKKASTTTNSAVDVAKNAVAHMQFVSGPYVYICSGGLLADSDTGTQRNYFLTANHCISKQGEANTLETAFLYTECGGSSGTWKVTNGVGAALLSGSRTSDYTLLELNGQVPAGTERLGWTADAVARTNNTLLYRISHPNGYPQAYSEHRVDTSAPTCRSWPRGNWIYSRDTVGATMGGSSGSPVVNADGEVVGQLSGACGYDVYNECNNDANATVDGAFAAYYDNISQWLGTGAPPPSGGENTPPTAGFDYATDQLTVNFTDTSTDSDGSVVSWNWNFGDGNTSTAQNPRHTYASSGTYTVTLTVTDDESATDSHSTAVTVSGGTSSTDTISISGLSGSSGPGDRGRWTVTVVITTSRTIDGAIVSGVWSGQAKGSTSCTTTGSACTVSKSNLKPGGSATLTITGIEAAGYTYVEGDTTTETVPAPQ